ncbi:hypothetical protein QLQ12_12200 [Actinoplanes sp. NEAU-A12]|uniref:Uncharacterized protein n=1 Tax=Actinoplanes sandaracinus TaxID=3045177 RepID=A0ABT6WI03_9ACTN|nr:hypothetical protein [Actinoplanes sandaracinus]MDI6099354.1 hypothetical protein [Actinoplanes sandaracinus]
MTHIDDLGRRTASAMRDTADQLETVEARLHQSAEESPDPETGARLHELGDEVTAQAKDVERRAGLLAEPEAPQRPDPA